MPISPKPKITVLDTSTESVSNEPGLVDAGKKQQVNPISQKTNSQTSNTQSPHPFFQKSKRPAKKKRKFDFGFTSSELSSDSGDSGDNVITNLSIFGREQAKRNNPSAYATTSEEGSDLEDEIPVKKIQLVTPNRSKITTTPNKTSKKSSSKTPARTPKSSSSVTPSKKGKGGLIEKIKTMYDELESLGVNDLNKNMLDYTSEVLSKKKMPELQKMVDKLQKMKVSSKSVPSHRTLVGTKTHHGLNYFDKVHQTIKQEGIRKLNGEPIESFINGFTHKDTGDVRKALFKGLYGYYMNKHERANWKRSGYLGDIDEDGCKWRAYSVILKIEGKLEPFMEKGRF